MCSGRSSPITNLASDSWSDEYFLPSFSCNPLSDVITKHYQIYIGRAGGNITLCDAPWRIKLLDGLINNTCIHWVVLLLLLELGLRAVVAGRDVSWSSEAGNAFALPADCMLVCSINKEINFNCCMIIILARSLPRIFHELLCHVGSQSLVLEERAPYL